MINVRLTVRNNWHSFARPNISTLPNGKFSFTFQTQEEIDLIWKKVPWVFIGVIMKLSQVNPRQSLL